MALIYCPNCAFEISYGVAFCPRCGRQLAPVPPVNGAGVVEDIPYFSGSVFDFGIWNCLKTESKNYWKRRRLRSFHSSQTSGVRSTRRVAKTKGQITKTWALGLLGVLGLHFFPIGRFITGTIRFFYGALMLVIGIAVTYSYRAAQDVEPLRILLVFLVAAFIPSVFDLILILSGRFRDVFRNHIR